MAKHAIGVVRRVTTLRNVTPLAIANTTYDAVMMELTVFTLMTYVANSKTVRSTYLTPTLSAATAVLLMIMLTSKGHSQGGNVMDYLPLT